MTDDDVERVARAIHRERQAAGYSGQAAWEHEPHEIHALYMRTARAAISAMDAKNKKLREALRWIAKQIPAKDMDEDYYEAADFEDSYDRCVFEARAALEEAEE